MDESSLEINLGSVSSFSGKLTFKLIVRNNGEAYIRTHVFDPSDMRISGVLLNLDEYSLNQLKSIIIKKEEAEQKFKTSKQINNNNFKNTTVTKCNRSDEISTKIDNSTFNKNYFEDSESNIVIKDSKDINSNNISPIKNKKYHLQISARYLSWPNKCACCEGISDSTYRASATRITGKRKINTKISWWEIPHCSTCINHIKKYKSIKIITIFFIIMTLIIECIALIIYDSMIPFFLILIFFYFLYFIFTNKIKKDLLKISKANCSSVSEAVEYVQWYGTYHDFIFTNKEYANSFVSLNNKKNMSNIKEI